MLAPDTPPVRDKGVVLRTLIRGTFALSELKAFVYLIKSLCPEVGHLGEFRDWDRVYNAAPEAKAPKQSIRLRQHIVMPGVPPGHGPSSKDAWPAFSLMYLGLPDRRVGAPCEKRPVTTVALGREAEALLAALGCVFVYEYVRKGVRYRTRQGFVIDVYIVEKLRKLHDPSGCEPLVEGGDQHGIVEIISEDGASPDELTAFLQHLQPFVTLRTPPKRR